MKSDCLHYSRYLNRLQLGDESIIIIMKKLICLQIIRLSSTGSETTRMMELLDKLFWHLRVANSSEPMILTQIAFVGTYLDIYDAPLLEVIVRRLVDRIDGMRFKDMDRICHVLAESNYKSDAATTLLTSIRRHLLTALPVSILSNGERLWVYHCIVSLHCCGFYDPHLIAWALEQNTISDVNIDGKKLLLTIDMFAKINLSDEYTGPRLSDAECARIAGTQDSNDSGEVQRIASFLTAFGTHCMVACALPHYAVPGESEPELYLLNRL